MAEEVKLFTSPFALRAVWALKIKGIDYETIFEDVSNKSPLLLQYNPVFKKVPVLVHNGKPIAESLVILEYIDETWKHAPLLPEDPHERATARFWAKFGEDKVLTSIWSVFIKQGKEQEEAMGPALETLKFLEEELKERSWLGNLISKLEEIVGLKVVDGEKFPLLSAWMQDFADAPIIKDNWPPRDRMIVKFQALRDATIAAAAAAAASK
ncbi:hypothetical protein AAG906_019067 [Vitis piasezkii]